MLNIDFSGINVTTIGVLVLAYLIGSIPFGLIIAKIRNVNIRESGSGNIGATNVCRAMGWSYGILTLVLDVGKGVLATEIGLYFIENPWLHMAVGLMAVVGHSVSFLARFRGGKGVATALGVLLALAPDVCIVVFCLGSAIIKITRYVSPATLLCSILVPILLLIQDYPMAYVIVHAAIAFLIVIRHRGNIDRLIQGTENRI
jgi:glycerol-3-phosphate acyltransferase PlsY